MNFVKHTSTLVFMVFSTALFTTSCTNTEKPPGDWTEWVQKAKEGYQKDLSVPSAIQHVYVEKEKGVVHLVKVNDKYKLSSSSDGGELISSYGFILKDKKLVKMVQDSEVTLEKPEDKISDRISIKVSFYESPLKARVFLYDQQAKNLAKKRQRNFFDYDSEQIKTFKYKALDKFETVTIQRSDGSAKEFKIVGKLSADGQNTLSVYSDEKQEEKESMLMFKDGTSGKLSYGAGRYVMVDFKKPLNEVKNGEAFEVNFNYTFNPPCASSTAYHCPLAQDKLVWNVKAGEKKKVY